MTITLGPADLPETERIIRRNVTDLKLRTPKKPNFLADFAK